MNNCQIDKIIKVAKSLDTKGLYLQADKLIKIAQRGVMNLDRLMPNAEKEIRNWLKTSLIDGDLPNAPEIFKGQYVFDLDDIPSFLKPYISKFANNVPKGALGSYDPKLKTINLPVSIPKGQLTNAINTIIHEIRHAVDPRFNNPNLIAKYQTRFYQPNKVSQELMRQFSNNFKVPDYNEFLINYMKDNRMDYTNPEIKQMVETTIPKSSYDLARNALAKGSNLYLNNPIEHPAQMGDIKNLLSKENLDKVRAMIEKGNNKKLSDLAWRNLLKNGLNPNNKFFEAFSDLLQQASGSTGLPLSKIVKETTNPKFQQQYLKQVSDALNVYTVGNQFKGLTRAENRAQPSNPNAARNLSAFLAKANEIEKLASQNPKLWERFMNSQVARNSMSSNVRNLFTGIGKGSKSLSQSIKGMNFNSPYWQLLEPAMEMSLNTFGKYLENPKSFTEDLTNASTAPIEKMLEKAIRDILTDPKIKNKLEYFRKYYTESLNQLPQPKREILMRQLGYEVPNSRIQTNNQNATNLPNNYDRFKKFLQ